jgi:hypothetical protein
MNKVEFHENMFKLWICIMIVRSRGTERISRRLQNRKYIHSLSQAVKFYSKSAIYNGIYGLIE